MRATTVRARAMRKALTPPEARLWVVLKGLRAHGFHFRRQAPFRGWYLDFACFDRRVSVEVDGAHHYWSDEQADRDLTRDGVLKREGFVVLRFTNADVRDRLDEVVDSILACLRDQCPTRPLRGHPPHKGEGEPTRPSGAPSPGGEGEGDADD